MNHEINLQTIADKIKAAQDQCKSIEPITSRFEDFGNDEAFAVTQLIHEKRIKEGAVPVAKDYIHQSENVVNLRGARADLELYI